MKTKYETISNMITQLMYQFDIGFDEALGEIRRVSSGAKAKFNWPTKIPKFPVFHYQIFLARNNITTVDIDSLITLPLAHALAALTSVANYATDVAFNHVNKLSADEIAALPTKIKLHTQFFQELTYFLMLKHKSIHIQSASEEIYNVMRGQAPRNMQADQVNKLLRKIKCDGFSMQYTQYLFPKKTAARLEEKVWKGRMKSSTRKTIPFDLIIGARVITDPRIAAQADFLSDWLTNASRFDKVGYSRMTSTILGAINQTKSIAEVETIMETTYLAMANWATNASAFQHPYNFIESKYGVNNTGRKLLSTYPFIISEQEKEDEWRKFSDELIDDWDAPVHAPERARLAYLAALPSLFANLTCMNVSATLQLEPDMERMLAQGGALPNQFPKLDMFNHAEDNNAIHWEYMMLPMLMTLALLMCVIRMAKPLCTKSRDKSLSACLSTLYGRKTRNKAKATLEEVVTVREIPTSTKSI